MAAFEKILKNNTVTDIVLRSTINKTIPASGQLIIETTEYLYLSTPEAITELTPLVNSGDIIVNNGTLNLTAAEGLRFIEYADRLKVSQTGTVKTKIVKEINILNGIVTDQGNGKVDIDVAPQGVSAGFDDVFHFGSGDRIKDKFIKHGSTSHTSVDSTSLLDTSGKIVKVKISTEKDPESNFFVQIIQGAFKDGGASPFEGGIQIGADIEKLGDGGTDDPNFLDLIVFEADLVGSYNFTVTDNISRRLAVYIKKGTEGPGEAIEPAIDIYVKYD